MGWCLWSLMALLVKLITSFPTRGLSKIIIKVWGKEIKHLYLLAVPNDNVFKLSEIIKNNII